MSKLYVLALSALATISIVSTTQYLRVRKPECHESAHSRYESMGWTCDDTASIDEHNQYWVVCKCPK
jgi:hypothetical protein